MRGKRAKSKIIDHELTTKNGVDYYDVFIKK